MKKPQTNPTLYIDECISSNDACYILSSVHRECFFILHVLQYSV